MEAIGIIGAGEIGWRMGKLLLAAGYTVIGYDIRPEALRRANESGFVVVDSIADLCRQVDFVLTCVTDGATLREVIAGPGGVADSLPAGKLVIDTTSAEPWITRELAPILADRGIAFLDAPVSGGVPAAEAGRMNFMIGGNAALIERCRAVLERLGPVIVHVGDVGDGHSIKAINMLALAASMLATAEVIAVGMHAGESLEGMIEVLDGGSGASYSTRVHFPRFIAPGTYASGFSFDLMLKDLSIGGGLAERCNVPLFLQRSTYELYRAAAYSGLGGRDNTRIVESLIANARGEERRKARDNAVCHLETLAAACNTVIAGESLCLGSASGLSASTVIKVLSAGSGDSHALSHRIPAYLEGIADKAATTLGDVWKSAAAVLSSLVEVALPAPLLMQAIAIHAAAIRRYGMNSDATRVIDLIGEWTNQRSAVRQQGQGATT